MRTHRIEKRTGAREPFCPEKLKRSLRRAGLAPEGVERVWTRLEHERPRTTAALRRAIEAALDEHDPWVAQRYARSRTLQAVANPELPPERVSLHPRTMARLGLEPGAPVLLEWAGGTRAAWVARGALVPFDRVWVSPALLGALRAQPGDKLVLRAQLLEGVPPRKANDRAHEPPQGHRMAKDDPAVLISPSGADPRAGGFPSSTNLAFHLNISSPWQRRER